MECGTSYAACLPKFSSLCEEQAEETKQLLFRVMFKAFVIECKQEGKPGLSLVCVARHRMTISDQWHRMHLQVPFSRLRFPPAAQFFQKAIGVRPSVIW